tara:strand:+ start:7227 stop:7493 length:267 start_codon:yes stop_codon:yes gene_type:complete
MDTVWKFPIVHGSNILELPRNPQWLTVGEQHGNLMVWVIVNDRNETTEYTIDVFGTGQELTPASLRYWIGTQQIGPFVWHVFMRRPNA